MTVRELLYNVTEILDSGGVENASFEAREIVAFCLKIKKSELVFRQNDICSDFTVNDAEGLAERRINNEPLQYIIGEWTFCSLPFKVGRGVLIPRPETEFIVYKSNEFLKKKGKKVVFDLCTGSGCIGISTAVNNPECEVYLFDISSDALCYAEKNMLLNGVKNVTILKYDITEGFKNNILPRPDLILSNPPYIESNEISLLQAEVLKEPVLALDGGRDGLDFYRIISSRWLPYINDGGMFILESGEDQPQLIKKMINGFSSVEIEKDIFSTDRFTVGYR